MELLFLKGGIEIRRKFTYKLIKEVQWHVGFAKSSTDELTISSFLAE
jgi:hypothetical protein